jgi:L-ascorbate metabolism protein UlaG (beta-lactamase superfamily)
MTSSGTSFLPGTVGVRLVGGPTALIEMGGLRFLTDPTFDPPGDHPVGNRVLVKTRGPAVAADDIGPVDAVLLSHDQHPDNLDDAGRRLLDAAPVVLTTGSAASRLGGTTQVLAPWRRVLLPRPAGGELRVTGESTTT